MALLGNAYVADSMTGKRVRGDPCAGTPEALRNSIVVTVAENRSLGDYDGRPPAKALRIPVLVIHGERDPIPVTSATEWAALIPGARMVVVHGSGRSPYAAQPEQFTAAVDEFLE